MDSRKPKITEVSEAPDAKERTAAIVDSSEQVAQLLKECKSCTTCCSGNAFLDANLFLTLQDGTFIHSFSNNHAKYTRITTKSGIYCKEKMGFVPSIYTLSMFGGAAAAVKQASYSFIPNGEQRQRQPITASEFETIFDRLPESVKVILQRRELTVLMPIAPAEELDEEADEESELEDGRQGPSSPAPAR